MSELVDFLTQRLDEDEAVARAATPGPWEAFRRGDPEGPFGVCADAAETDGGDVVPDSVGGPSKADAEHVARHDPARVLREVTAKRAILAKYQRAQAAYEQMVNPASTAAVFALAEVVQHMATVYEDHPDFQEQWR